MENRTKRVLLTRFLLASAALIGTLQFTTVYAKEAVQVIEPDIHRRQIKIDAIDSENFEIGVFYGIISIEDFSSNDVYGVRGTYHLTEDFFFEASYGSSEGDLTSFEKLSGGSPLLNDSDREYNFYDISVGWNVLPGEVFILEEYAFNSALYLVAGIGSTEFAGDSWLTVNLGAGFKLLLSDAIAWHIDVRDHIFDRDTFGADQTTHNIEFSTGITVFF